ncbi:hypothetical protein MHK_002861 [Candidatus Magnetomorum sp. HK-1]|nr:hypothetical protein MHK_002861 [Candidatus Magnetomorum sp. HK-1]
MIGQAALFDGSSNIKTPINLNGIEKNQYLTISFWGYASDSKYSTFVTNRNVGDGANSVHSSLNSIGLSGGFSHYGGGGYFLKYYPLSIEKNTELLNWTYYTLTYDNQTEKIYVNGILILEQNIGANQIGGYNGADTYPIYDKGSGNTCYTACFDRLLNIGSYNNSFYSFGYRDTIKLKGKIDDLRIYNRPLSDSEISILYKKGQEALIIDNSQLDTLSKIINILKITAGFRTEFNMTDYDTNHDMKIGISDSLTLFPYILSPNNTK